MDSKTFLTFNVGSSTIKIGIYRLANAKLSKDAFAKVDLLQTPITLDIHKEGRDTQVLLKAPLAAGLSGVVEEVLGYLESRLVFNHLIAVGHRIVHGGDLFVKPVVLGQAEITSLETLIPLAPLHQPQALLIVRAIERLRPHLIQTASFDTAFHQTQSNVVRHYAIPQAWFDEGIKRFGFHGLSYQYIHSRLHDGFPALENGKVIIAHLGSGASLCAIHEGQSRDSSMGFSTLGGVPMATRCGDLDVGAALYLLHEKGLSTQKLEHMLYKESGLLGVSGLSGNVKELLVMDDPGAHLAIELFTLRIAGEIGRMASTLNGLQSLVFTGGIGEHQAEIRSKICARLSWLGVDLNEQLNNNNTTQEKMISSTNSKITVLVVPTNEEAVIAKDLVGLLKIQGYTS